MKVLPKRFHFNGHTKGFIYKLKTLLPVSATDFGTERVIKSCLFFQSSHMNSSTKSHSTLTVHGFTDCFLENTSLPQPNHTLNVQSYPVCLLSSVGTSSMNCCSYTPSFFFHSLTLRCHFNALRALCLKCNLYVVVPSLHPCHVIRTTVESSAIQRIGIPLNVLFALNVSLPRIS